MNSSMSPRETARTGDGASPIQRVLLGIAWAGIFYWSACFVTGAITGFVMGIKDPAHAQAAAARASAEVVSRCVGYFVVGAVILSAAGTWFGVLPGTRARSGNVGSPEPRPCAPIPGRKREGGLDMTALLYYCLNTITSGP